MRSGWFRRCSVWLVWGFNVLGFADFLAAVAQGLRYTQPAEMRATYFIPIFVVPPLFVSHLLIFWVLVAKGSRGKV